MACILLKPGLLPDIGLDGEDFYVPRHRATWSAMAGLQGSGKPIDIRTVQASLESAGESVEYAFLAGLDLDLPDLSRFQAYADVIRERRRDRDLAIAARTYAALQPGTPADEHEDAVELLRVALEHHRTGSATTTGREGFAEFMAQDFPVPISLLGDGIVRLRQLGMIHAWRGIGKTWVSLSMALSVATGTPLWAWDGRDGEGRPVLYVDGEMDAGELQGRLRTLYRGICADRLHMPSDPPLYVLSKSSIFERTGALMPHIDTPAGQRWIESRIEDAEVLILDNVSSLTSSEENEAGAWGPVQDWLIRLRARGLSVWVVHHSGKGGDQRGTSKREDPLDVVLRLERPPDYRPEHGCHLTATFTKSREIRGSAAASIEARLGPHETVPDALTWSYTPAEVSKRKRVQELRDQGVKVADIVKTVGISRATYFRWVKEE